MTGRFARSAERGFSVRPLFFLSVAVLMIIVGLLGMHTFSADSAGHGFVAMGKHQGVMAGQAAMPGDASPHGTALAAHLGAPTVEAVAPAAVNATAPGSHGGAMLICVLALFAGLLLLIVPAPCRGAMVLLPQQQTSALLTATSAYPRPPSLVFLSISRT